LPIRVIICRSEIAENIKICMGIFIHFCTDSRVSIICFYPA